MRIGTSRLPSRFIAHMLRIEDQIYPAVEVIADETGSTILLGRNFLNRLILLLDGPNQQSDILLRRPVKM